jgi:hypothetical protein
MEPLTILGLASNLIQLLEFSSSVLGEAHRLIRSSRDTTKRYTKLLELSTLNNSICGRLKEHLSAGQTLDTDDKLLLTAVEACESSLKELDNALQKLRVDSRPDGTKPLKDVFLVVIKAHFKREDIEGMLKNVECAQGQLSNVLLNLIR